MRFRRNYNRFRDSVCILGKNDAEQNPSHKCAVIRRISFSEKSGRLRKTAAVYIHYQQTYSGERLSEICFFNYLNRPMNLEARSNHAG